LFERIGQHGDHVIATLISEQVQLMAEHVIDQRLLDGVAEILQTIDRPSWPVSLVEGIHTERTSEVVR
jgi:hypothetical protein